MKPLQVNNSPRGQLSTEEFCNFPFEPKRFFITSKIPQGETRGKHAHRRESQVLICLSGQIRLINESQSGVSQQTLRPNECFFLDKLVWSEQVYEEEGTVLLCFCSENFDEDEYIRNKEEFYDIVNKDKR